MKTLCEIYKSSEDEQMYLYVKKSEGLDKVPRLLLDLFGKPMHVMTLALYPGKKLAHADVIKVLASIDEHGFYLQMPVKKDTYMQKINIQRYPLIVPR